MVEVHCNDLKRNVHSSLAKVRQVLYFKVISNYWITVVDCAITSTQSDVHVGHLFVASHCCAG